MNAKVIEYLVIELTHDEFSILNDYLNGFADGEDNICCVNDQIENIISEVKKENKKVEEKELFEELEKAIKEYKEQSKRNYFDINFWRY